MGVGDPSPPKPPSPQRGSTASVCVLTSPLPCNACITYGGRQCPYPKCPPPSAQNLANSLVSLGWYLQPLPPSLPPSFWVGRRLPTLTCGTYWARAHNPPSLPLPGSLPVSLPLIVSHLVSLSPSRLCACRLLPAQRSSGKVKLARRSSDIRLVQSFEFSPAPPSEPILTYVCLYACRVTR